MPSYKLVYYDGKGRAETIRLAFVFAGIPFEDVRLSSEEWLPLKPKSFSGKMPYLEVDGKVLVESMAIARYVAKEGGLLGKSNFEGALVDSVVEVVTNLYLKLISTKFAPEGHKEEAKKEFKEKHLAFAVNLLEKFLGDKKFLVSDEATLADLHFFSIFEFLSDFHWEQTHPKLKALRERVAALPRVAEYLKTRPETDF